MVKKLKELAEDTELASAVRSSAQQIWQAGLGAFAKAQEEGGRVFSKLVKEGTEFQKRAEDKVADVSGSVSKLADGVGKQASGSWDKLEQVFEERVARALATIGVPMQNDIAALHAKIDALSVQVAALSGKAAPAAKPKAVAKPAAKTAPKTAPKAAVAKAPGKAPAKTTAKAVPRTAAKSVTKPVTKPAASKPAVRPAAKKKASPA
ncbi:poly(hydroxyalcanoate) granule associated protein (phasin) [Janthinobacterium sp. HH103]|uniref:Polygranule-associated protein n=1 Tax=Janthinobacterium agaricidamnosum TaxID=55508 RepID=A0A3G2E803_9BURK|nr:MULTISPECIES: phasin family protein [Janthinobacterium]AYM75629.1 polygranule-associated protein [Janthinobacterium agaricidamnosum]OEZ64855.1 poly(hydroxyalcanoate) granule associated protein (phasin) [Janthinobacterium sp. HH100]OEZ66671.1 poly(hydroxyalcanoate) granule associated protein (phasin) [Janthinobacterium sp. HH103]OEZ92830.1 poly(hydroxyalcanoate) granule associated protein (phasin) [Janthinobacterium sp. HH107]QOU72661.1 Poly(hydroxyalcanoate) granule associated protein (phas